MKKICFVFAIALLIISSNVFAIETASSPCYKSIMDFNDKGFVYNVTFENGDVVNLTETNLRHTFLIINGNFENLPILIENNVSYAPAKDLCIKLGLKYEELLDNSYCLGEVNSVYLYPNSDLIKINSKSEKMPNKTKLIGEDLYIPLRYISERFGYSVSYTKEIIAPLNNPVIDINSKKNNISKDEAIKTAARLMEECYNTFLQNKSLIESGTEETKEIIHQKIEKIQCIGETSSYWVLKGPYLLLADKSSGEVFVKYGNGKAGHGSYLESITRVNSHDKDFFSRDYYLG